MSNASSKDFDDEPPIRSEGFSIFRVATAGSMEESHSMEVAPLDPVEEEGLARLTEAGMYDGSTLKLLFSAPGMSLVHAWFRSGFILPRHTHNVDCVYYVVSGSLQIGTETLGAGDGFFIAANAPYSYVAGPHGLEILEFRTADKFNIQFLAKNAAFWERAVKTAKDRRSQWQTERPPSAALSG